MRVTTSIPINAPAVDVWHIIGPGFGKVSDWATTVAESRLVGDSRPDGAPFTGRACTIAEAGFDHLSEEILTYEPSSLTLSYRASSGMPSIVERAVNTWSVVDDGPHSAVFTMDAEVHVSRRARLLGPAVRIYLGMFARRTSKDLKVYAETNEVSSAKHLRRSRRRLTRLDLLVTANATFSALCGIASAVHAPHWSRQFADASADIFVLIGVSLLAFSAVIAGVAGRGASASAGKVISALDWIWVAATVALLVIAGTEFTLAGLIAATSTGAIVGVFAWTQYRAAQRLSKSSRAVHPLQKIS